jgi:predicted phage terminase large subunit-like protein
MATNQLVRRALLQDEQLKRLAERSLRAFVEQAWPVLEPSRPFRPNWHIDLVCEHLEAISTGATTRLLINLPPRSMKSLLVSVLWPTWEWIRWPGLRYIVASYTDALAAKHSLDRRTVLQSPLFQSRWGDRVILAPDQNEKGEFLNTARGHMIATSVGGSILGKGGDRIIIDDPHNPTQIESDAQREAAITHFKTLATRLDDKKHGAVVVVQQRLHEGDLSAVCLALGGYVHLCLPAEAEERTEIVFPSGRRVVREPGDLLWPDREGRAELDEQKKVLGTAMYTAQYQQQPTAARGAIFQREWFRFYDVLPVGAQAYNLQSWDLSFKGDQSSDYVVGLMAARAGAHIYLMNRRRGQWSFTETIKQVRALVRDYPDTRTILVEEAANGHAVINTLQQQIPGLIGVTPLGGKLARAQAASATVEAGNLWLPNPYTPRGQLIPERAWVEELIEECCRFPRGKHDDQVDALTQLIARCVEDARDDHLFQGLTWGDSRPIGRRGW